MTAPTPAATHAPAVALPMNTSNPRFDEYKGALQLMLAEFAPHERWYLLSAAFPEIAMIERGRHEMSLVLHRMQQREYQQQGDMTVAMNLATQMSAWTHFP